jgi:hypothetical protein
MFWTVAEEMINDLFSVSKVWIVAQVILMTNSMAAWFGLWPKRIVNYQLRGSMIWIVAEENS